MRCAGAVERKPNFDVARNDAWRLCVWEQSPPFLLLEGILESPRFPVLMKCLVNGIYPRKPFICLCCMVACTCTCV